MMLQTLTNKIFDAMKLGCVFSKWNLQLQALCIVKFYLQPDLHTKCSLSMLVRAGSESLYAAPLISLIRKSIVAKIYVKSITEIMQVCFGGRLSDWECVKCRAVITNRVRRGCTNLCN